MAEDEVTGSQHDFMEIMEPPDMTLSLLSEPENLQDDLMLISPLNPSLDFLPALGKHQLLMETECEVSSNTGENQERTGESFSLKDSNNVRETDPLFRGELIPTELSQSSKGKIHKCTTCNKVFRTANAVNKHLLTHQLERSHVCNICQKGFKRLDHLSEHMLTHQKKFYCCSHPGCQKMYCGYRSLKRHCDTKHGAYNLPQSCQSYNLNPQPCPPQWELPKLPALNDGVLTSAKYNTYFPQLQSKHIFHFEAYNSHETSYNNYTLAANVGHNPEHLNPSKIKLPVSSESLNLGADGAFCDLVSAARAHHKKPTILPLPPAPKIETKKNRVKNKILRSTNIPTPPLPPPRPTTQRRPRPCPGYFVSPSQVAMASFSKESASSDTIKSTVQGRSATAMTGNGRQLCKRTYLKYPPSRHAPFSPSHPQAPTASGKKAQHLMLAKDGRVGSADDWYQTDQKGQLSRIVIPVSVPVSSKVSGPTIKKQQNIEPLSKKTRHPGILRSVEAGCFLSQLRSPTYLTDHLLNFDPPPYTPPPMLSPLRPGTGLYFNTLPQSQPCLPPTSISSASLDGEDGISLISENTVVSIEPKINVGSRFQAEIPPLRIPFLILYDEHPAQLVWAPCRDLRTNPETQQKVTEFLDMCCSSVLPGGGTNTELALHCLHEVQGDILAALDLLLFRGDYRTSCHLLSDQHYTGSDHWTTQEMRVFQKVLLNQTKDFQLIHKALQTKSVAQCVEYYYTMKKLKKFKQH